jgi:hypothetical protein
VNPPLRSRPTEPAITEFLTSHPGVSAAIEHARLKIQAKARTEVAILASNLGIILADWCSEHKITSIGWASDLDQVPPEFGLQVLADKLSQKLAEARFTEFLERFADDLIELDQAERRSQ